MSRLRRLKERKRKQFIKTIMSSLALALVMGASQGVTTHAWFTDEEIIDNDLIITMGNLDVEIGKGFNMNNDAQSLENIFSIGVAYKIDNDNLEKPDPGNPENPGTHVDGSTDGKLPQTGGIINSYSLLAIGTITIGTGILLNRKTSKEKGGKHHE